MKTPKLFKNIGLLLFFGLTLIACSSDDSKGGGSPNYLENVPKGEIVPTAQRFVTLTGYEESAATKSTSATALSADSQKWWKYKDAAFEYKCDGEHEIEELEEDGSYYAFYPNGKIYYKYGVTGTPIAHHGWEWTDSSKSKIRIITNDGESVIFEFTELNSKTVVYASYQSEGNCSVLTWERFVAAEN